MHDKKAYFDRAFTAGAKGNLLKNGNMDEVFSTIHKVNTKEYIVGQGIFLNK